MAASRRLAAMPPGPGRGVGPQPQQAIGGDPGSDAQLQQAAPRRATPMGGFIPPGMEQAVVNDRPEVFQGGAMPGQPPMDPTMFATPGGPGGPFGQAPPGADVNRMTGFGPNVQGPEGGTMNGAGLPPQIMQRLQALRSGGVQGGAPGQAPGGVAGPQRSFQDFWQGGMTPRGM
jgi:hypothetical protein